jgi:hypothetical protein
VLVGFLFASRLLMRCCLGVEPGLRDEDRQHAEQDGERYHHDGAGTHATSSFDAKLCSFISNVSGQYRGLVGINS